MGVELGDGRKFSVSSWLGLSPRGGVSCQRWYYWGGVSRGWANILHLGGVSG